METQCPAKRSSSARDAASPRWIQARGCARQASLTTQTSTRLADYLCDCVCAVVDVLAIERGDADTAALDGIDRVLLAHAQHLILGQAGIGEHAALAQDEAPVGAGYAALDAIDQGLAHQLDAVAHGAQLLVPELLQLGI